MCIRHTERWRRGFPSVNRRFRSGLVRWMNSYPDCDGDYESLEKNCNRRRQSSFCWRIVGFTVHQSRKDVVTVQTGKAQRRIWLSIVSASGEIRPKTYVNIGANAFGKITRLYVKEGDQVKKGQLLAQLENVQSSADVNATQASVRSSADRCDRCRRGDEHFHGRPEPRPIRLRTRQTGLGPGPGSVQRRADRQVGIRQPEGRMGRRRKPDWRRPRRASRRPRRRRIPPNATSRRTSANLTHAADVLQKTTYAAPYDGMITNLPVREGETVVIGIQNSPGSTLMTLADMSVITAEVKVDETDIVNVVWANPPKSRSTRFRRRLSRRW